MQQSHDPHADQPVLRAGPAIADARLVAILLHGRGATAEDILGLSREFSAPDVTYLAPQASGQTWYPYSFLAPIQQNEPGISSAFRVIAGLLQDLQRQDVSSDRVVLMGFSQGACLTLECAARHAQRYAAVVAFSGGLIGPQAHRAITQVDSMARLCSWGAVTSMPTYPSSGYTNRPRCSVEWGQRLTNASIRGWATP